MIPEMDNYLGRYWKQPFDIRKAPMDETHVILTSAQMRGLAEYSSTIPSGVYSGKCWLRREADKNLLMWYGVETISKTFPIEYRIILEV